MKKRNISGLSRSQSGFTLMEVLIVVAILGILAAVAIPRFTALYGRGRTESANEELRIIRMAVGAYMHQNDGVAVEKDDEQLDSDDIHYGHYLQTSTAYKYTITLYGEVTQGDRAE